MMRLKVVLVVAVVGVASAVSAPARAQAGAEIGGGVTVLAQAVPGKESSSSRGLNARSTARLVKLGVGCVALLGVGVSAAYKKLKQRTLTPAADDRFGPR